MERPMERYDQLYIGGQWVAPEINNQVDVINPCTEEPFARVVMGGEKDVDRAVEQARKALPQWSQTPVDQRVKLLNDLADAMEARQDEIGDTISREMGMPSVWSRMIQAGLPVAASRSMAEILSNFEFQAPLGNTMVVREPIGVCGFITPWNYPLHQVIGKVAPALAAGCTMVLKPSQLAPIDAFILADILDKLGLPPGVFNLVTGSGSQVGAAIAAHPGIDMVSLTGSTRSGVLVAQAAAQTIKRVTLELGGKSPNVLLEDADFDAAVSKGMFNCYLNSGQTCTALSRMIVPQNRQEEVIDMAMAAIAVMEMGDAFDDQVYLGPMVDEAQQASVRRYIESGVAEGATLVEGGPEQPEELPKGYYVKPTIFADVTPEMTIAKEEIFGPVLCIMPYDTEEQAVAIANDTVYGLSGSVWSSDLEKARTVAGRLACGQVFINGADFDVNAPAGGYKQSGLGRERSRFGLEEYLEVKAMIGYGV